MFLFSLLLSYFFVFDKCICGAQGGGSVVVFGPSFVM